MARGDGKGRLVSFDNGQPIEFAPPADELLHSRFAMGLAFVQALRIGAIAHERRVREQVAREIEEMRDGVVNPDKPYNEAFMHGADCAARVARGEGR